MNNILEALKIAGFGLIGIFTAILIIYLMILLLQFAFPSQKRVKRIRSKETGEILEEIEISENE